MPAPDAITADKLAKLIGTPRCPILLDVRAEKVRASDPRVVPAARPLDEAEIAPDALKSLAATLSGPAVVICAEGHRRSQGVAALLRASDVPAEYLEGGQAAWVAAGLPLLDPGKITARDAEGRSVWVTRSRPKIDRIACPWLIRRFVDPRAVFLYVAPAEVLGTAELFGAMTYEAETGVIEVVANTLEDRKDLTAFMARDLLGIDFKEKHIPWREYDLSILLKPFDFPTDPEDGIMGVTVKELRFMELGERGERITLESMSGAERTIWEMAEKRIGLDIGGTGHLLPVATEAPEWVITRARFTIKFHPGPEGGRAKSLTLTVTMPHGCNLKDMTPHERLRIVARRADTITDFGDARLWSETTRIDLLVAEVPAPRPGDRIEIDGEAFLIQGEPVRDRERLVWTVDLRPV